MLNRGHRNGVSSCRLGYHLGSRFGCSSTETHALSAVPETRNTLRAMVWEEISQHQLVIKNPGGVFWMRGPEQA